VVDGPTGHEPAPGEAPRTDEEAIASMRAWLVDLYGPLPEIDTLVVASVHQQTSFREGKPRSEWPILRTVHFVQSWLGVPTDRSATLAVVGRGIDGSMTLSRLRPIPGTERNLLTEHEARNAVARVLRDLGRADQPAESVPLTLQYIYDWRSDDSVDLRPVWMLADGPFVIDAHTGEPGRNG